MEKFREFLAWYWDIILALVFFIAAITFLIIATWTHNEDAGWTGVILFFPAIVFGGIHLGRDL